MNRMQIAEIKLALRISGIHILNLLFKYGYNSGEAQPVYIANYSVCSLAPVSPREVFRSFSPQNAYTYP